MSPRRRPLMPNLDLLIPRKPVEPDRWDWATVVGTNPLRVRWDGDNTTLDMPASPPTDVPGTYTVGQRVWCQRRGRRIIVHSDGASSGSGGGGSTTLAVQDTSSIDLTLQGSAATGYLLSADYVGEGGGSGGGGTCYDSGEKNIDYTNSDLQSAYGKMRNINGITYLYGFSIQPGTVSSGSVIGTYDVDEFGEPGGSYIDVPLAANQNDLNAFARFQASGNINLYLYPYAGSSVSGSEFLRGSMAWPAKNAATVGCGGGGLTYDSGEMAIPITNADFEPYNLTAGSYAWPRIRVMNGQVWIYGTLRALRAGVIGQATINWSTTWPDARIPKPSDTNVSFAPVVQSSGADRVTFTAADNGFGFARYGPGSQNTNAWLPFTVSYPVPDGWSPPAEWVTGGAAGGGEAIGISITSPDVTDLNDYDVPGVYSQRWTNNAANGTNYPEGVAGLLEVENNGVNMVWQRYTPYGSYANKFYLRSRYNTSWSGWTKFEGTAV